jgi:hypothetical protein
MTAAKLIFITACLPKQALESPYRTYCLMVNLTAKGMPLFFIV